VGFVIIFLILPSLKLPKEDFGRVYYDTIFVSQTAEIWQATVKASNR
jgi:hypothetical protein